MQCNFSKLRMSFATFGKRHCICSFVHESLSKENRFLQKPEKISSFLGDWKWWILSTQFSSAVDDSREIAQKQKWQFLALPDVIKMEEIAVH